MQNPIKTRKTTPKGGSSFILRALSMCIYDNTIYSRLSMGKSQNVVLFFKFFCFTNDSPL